VLRQLVAYLRSLGLEPITGKPYKPPTQEKNEKIPSTLLRYLQKRPLSGALEQLRSQADDFDLIYNTQRPHHGPTVGRDQTETRLPDMPGLPRPPKCRSKSPSTEDTEQAGSNHRSVIRKQVHG